MEMQSPPPCPATVTIRRNPPRKARATPSSAIPISKQLSSPSLSRNIFSTEILQNPIRTDDGSSTDSSIRILSENLKVFLRIRPLTVQKNHRNVAELKNAWPKNPKNSRPKVKKSCEICLQVNEDMRSVTVSTPKQLQETKRIKSEIYEGFSHVFASEAAQTDVYEQMVKPLVEDFLRGKSGMLAAMGPSGSGKTHTVFGSAREPGMVPLAIRRIFGENENPATQTSRVFYFSMFEISSEKGKAERMTDLLHDGGDISMQQSVIKGLQEAAVSDAHQAESLIAHGMLRRATATTNSNTQSSRSQCIINIRYGSTHGEVDGTASSSMLTIVDLAGAEREKKTGNQGARLLESNFINNTSMVFGQCLRSLLEHQRNRNKPLPKHYKNSLLTRYLQDYLEGKKRMSLILTVKPGVEEYLDTSFLLRQTSPFTRIKFKTVEEPVNLTCNKRPHQALPQAGQLKKMKFTSSEASLIDEGNIDRGHDLTIQKEIPRKEIKGCLNNNIEEAHDANINEIHVLSDGFAGLGIQEKSSLKGDYGKPNVKKDREYLIMQGLSKAMWTVLKQYKEKLEGVETENCRLRDSLDKEKTRSLDLENELIREKMSLFDLENELKELKSRCTCGKASSDVFPVSVHDASLNPSQHQMAELVETNSEILSCSSRELENAENGNTDPSQLQDPSQRLDDTEDFKVLTTSSNSSQELICHEDVITVDTLSGSRATSQPTSGSLCTTSHKIEQRDDTEDTLQSSDKTEDSTSSDSSQELICHEDMITVDRPSAPGSRATSQPTSGSLSTSYKTEKDDTEDPFQSNDDTEDMKVPSTSSKSSHELICHEDMITVNMPSGSRATSQPTSGSLSTSHKTEQDAVDIVGDVKNLEQKSDCKSNGHCFATSVEFGSANSTQDYEDPKDVKQEVATQFMPSRSQAISHSTSGFCINHNSDQDATENVGGLDNLEPESSECASTGSSFDTSLECEESTKSIQDSEDLKDAKQEQTRFEKNGIDLSLIEVRIVPVAAHSDTAPNSSESAVKDETCYHMDEEQRKNEEGKEPLDSGLPEEGLNAKRRPKFVPSVAPCSNFQLAGKPKRRLQPVSSVLLKDLSFLSIKDENDRPKGGRVGKKGPVEDKTRTQGSLSLLNLLTQ